jgi:hypothetical protein
MSQRHLWRRVHRSLVPLAALPLLLTALSGSLYGTLSAQGIEAFWLMKLHTGNFGLINLQPWYSPILALLTLFVIGSGMGLLLGSRRGSKQAPPTG